MSNAHRYMTAYIDPWSGRERLGTGPDAQCFHRYASVANVIRFGLAKEVFPPGQYNIYLVSGPYLLRVGTGYKRV